MRPLLGVSHHQLAVIAGAGALAALSLGVLSARGVSVLALSLAVAAVVALARPTTIGWDRLIALILVVVLLCRSAAIGFPEASRSTSSCIA